MSTRHTPGPWIVKENRAYKTSWLIYDPEGNQLAQVANWQGKTFNCDAEINARLIAAAPELLEALEIAQSLAMAWVAYWATCPFVEKGIQNKTNSEFLFKISAAIAKAKGEAQ